MALEHSRVPGGLGTVGIPVSGWVWLEQGERSILSKLRNKWHFYLGNSGSCGKWEQGERDSNSLSSDHSITRWFKGPWLSSWTATLSRLCSAGKEHQKVAGIRAFQKASCLHLAPP